MKQSMLTLCRREQESGRKGSRCTPFVRRCNALSRSRTAIGSVDLGELASRSETFPCIGSVIMPARDRAARPRWRCPRRRRDVGIRILDPCARCSRHTFQEPLFGLGELLGGATAVAGGVRGACTIGKVTHRPRHIVWKRARSRIAVIAMAAVLINVTGRGWRQSMQTDAAQAVAYSAAISACRTRIAALTTAKM